MKTTTWTAHRKGLEELRQVLASMSEPGGFTLDPGGMAAHGVRAHIARIGDEAVEVLFWMRGWPREIGALRSVRVLAVRRPDDDMSCELLTRTTTADGEREDWEEFVFPGSPRDSADWERFAAANPEEVRQREREINTWLLDNGFEPYRPEPVAIPA